MDTIESNSQPEVKRSTLSSLRKTENCLSIVKKILLQDLKFNNFCTKTLKEEAAFAIIKRKKRTESNLARSPILTYPVHVDLGLALNNRGDWICSVVVGR